MERNAIVNNSGNQTSPRTPLQESPSTFDRRGARAREYQARPPARFSSLRSDKTVNQKQQPSGNTLLAQRYLLSGNSYFWRTAGWTCLAAGKVTISGAHDSDHACFVAEATIPHDRSRALRVA